MIRSIAIVALTATTLIAGNAHAQTRENAQVRVSASNIDFTNARETRSFYAKLNAAAARVCSSEFSDPLTQMEDAQCAREAVSNAVADINAPALSALDAQAERAPAYAERPTDSRRN